MLARLLSVLALVSGALACSAPPRATSDAGGSDTTLPDDRTAPDDRTRVPDRSGVHEEPSHTPYLTALTVSWSPPDAGASDAAPDAISDAEDVADAVYTGDTGDAGDTGTEPPLTLVPAFSSTVYDYYVRCTSGTNAITVSMTAAPGAKSLLVQPTTSPTLPTQTVALRVQEDQAIVLAATDGASTTEYWVRCLPHDFPKIRMERHPDAGVPLPGYYLVGTSEPVDARWGYAVVLNGDGVPVWYVHGSSGMGVEDVDDVVAGAVTFVPTNVYPFEVHFLSPLESTTVAPAGDVIDTHELRVLENGDYLVLSNPTLTGVDMTGYDVPLSDGGVASFGPNSNIMDCDIVEFDPKTGAVVWTWVGSEHFNAATDNALPVINHVRLGPDGLPVLDPFHCNSIDVDPRSHDLLVSSRDMDSIFYIDRSTGKVVWKMGGVAYTKDDAVYVSVSDAFHRQHDARLMPGWSPTCAGGSGQISLFDDETYLDASARAVVLDVVVGTGDGGTSGDCGAGDGGTSDGAPGATLAWQYSGTTSSLIRGSFRILPDGSRVIGWGSNVPDLVFSEVDEAKHDLLDFYFTDGDVSYRAIKVPLSAFDLDVLRQTAARGAL